MKPNILIVEDNQTKRTEIEKALNAALSAEVAGVPSISQAYRSIEFRQWDLIVLDMTFQVAQTMGQESAKEALAGIEILQFIARKQIPTPVIVATQHSSFSTVNLPDIDSIRALDELLSDLFPENYRGTVEVDLSEEAWKTILQRAVVAALHKS